MLRKKPVRALLLLFAAGALAAPAQAKSLQVVGCAGVLGEWELTATVTENARWMGSEFSGPLSMKHIGICTQDGPEERTGEIRFQISALSSRMDATLLVEGQRCTYSAGAADPYSGVLACPDGKAVPLKLWLK
jgi:hypothetical protein